MRQTILAIILCMLATDINANYPYYPSKFLGIGVRTFSAQSLNDVLKNEGLLEINPIAYNFCIGRTSWNEVIIAVHNGKYTSKITDRYVLNSKINVFVSNNKDDLNRTVFSGLGYSLDFGYPIWKNDKMFLYPYFNLSYMFSRLKTQMKTNANSLTAVYNQPLVERTFYNFGELDVAFGLAYRVKLGTSFMIEVGGGYHFPISRSKWRYVNNKIDFPKIDCRGWLFGIVLGINILKE